MTIMMLTELLLTTESLSKESVVSFSDRVLMLLSQQKRSKSWLAEEIGVSKQALNYILMHSSKKKCINEIALALGVNPEWLKTGKGSFVLNLQSRDDVVFIPLMSIETIASKRSDTKSTLAVSATYAADCFAVILDNDSMEPLFTEGSILIVDPTKKPKNRDFVLFSVPGSADVYFRQCFKEGQDYYFKAVASMYETLKHREITLHGTLVESRHRFK